MPAGCIHWPIGDKKLLEQWVTKLASTPAAVGILMGDSTDLARTHFREHIRGYKSDKNSQEALDEYVRAEIGKLAQVLSPVKERLLGAILGNHYWEFKDGTNSEQFLCKTLEIPYLGPQGVVRLDFDGINKKKGHKVTIWAHHNGGSRSASSTASDVRVMEKAEQSFDADIYLLSHTHRRHAFKTSRMGITDSIPPKLIEHTKVLVRTGAMLRGVMDEDEIRTDIPHFPSYGEEAAYRSLDLGFVEIKITFANGFPEYTVSY